MSKKVDNMGSTVVFEGRVNVCVGDGVSDGVGIRVYIKV